MRIAVNRKFRIGLHCTLQAALAVIASVGAHASTTTEKTIARGVVYIQEIQSGDRPRLINVIKVSLNEPGAKVQYGQANDVIALTGKLKGREPLSFMAERNRAVAAINGDFAAYTSDPLGLGVLDGELLSEPMDFRVCAAMMADRIEMAVMVGQGAATIGMNEPLPIDGINRMPQDGEIILETPRFGGAMVAHKAGIMVQIGGANLPLKVSQALTGTVESVIPIEKNDPLPACPKDKAYLIAFGPLGEALGRKANRNDAVKVLYDLTSNLPAPLRSRYPSRAGRLSKGYAATPVWQDVKQAISGGPWLVQQGKVAVDFEGEGFDERDFVMARHPRTAFGVTSDGKALLVTVDGRAAWSSGATLPEMGEIMLHLGAVNAINLDGGGSTAMIVGGGVVNCPSDGGLRAICNGLLVYGEPILPAVEPNDPRIEPNIPDGFQLNIGDQKTFKVVQADGSPLPSDMSVVWGTEEGLGLILQNGAYKSMHSGRETITARVGNRTLRSSIQIKAPEKTKPAPTLSLPDFSPK